jgi:hypothetical protein
VGDGQAVKETGLYAVLPFELFFAIADSMKYIQAIYIAKWIDRQHMMLPFAIWFMLLGMSQWPLYYY